MKALFSAAGAAGLLAACTTLGENAAEDRSMAQAGQAPPRAQLSTGQIAPNGMIPTKNGNLRVERLAALEEPWGMAMLPDGGLLITEKPGRLRLFSGGELSAPLGGVPAVAYFGQGGLLDVAVDPNFAKNRMVYLSYAEAAMPQPPGVRETQEPRLATFQRMEDQTLKGGAVARGRLEGGTLRDVQVIWRQYPKTVGRGHFGGRLTFAPDGTLFISSSERMRAARPSIRRCHGRTSGNLVYRAPQSTWNGFPAWNAAALGHRVRAQGRRRA
jgi:glucose/arabinose dehydrogenase